MSMMEMENTSMNLENDGVVEEDVHGTVSKGQIIVLKSCRRVLQPGRILMLSIQRSRTRAITSREMFVYGLHSSIPKHLTTLDEKYVLRCLELIRKCAMRAAFRNFNSKPDVSADVNNVAGIENSTPDDRNMIDWSIGNLSCSPSMINILKSPLLREFGSFDGLKSDLIDSGYTWRTKKSSRSLSFTENDHTYVSQPVHKKAASSISSTNSSSSDQSTTPISFQGMLQCTWKDRVPHHVFTVDEKQEVYAARLSNPSSSGGNFVYTFSRRNGKKDFDSSELDMESVAKMRVSTLNHSEVRETQFVISVFRDGCTGETRATNNSPKKNNRLTRKVTNALRSSRASKHRSLSGHRGSSSFFEDTFWESHEDGRNNSRKSGDGDADDKEAPNFELATIVIRDIYNNHNKAELGGWGLKFLKGPEKNSTSIDVLIPAGIHGGPRSRVGGPSSLIERWRSGGRCDCGGWDLGCPLTVLNTSFNCTDHTFSNSGDCESIDLFMQSPNRNVPIMKMVNIHKGLYYIHFQPILSTLQSFGIAAAVIHSQSPNFEPQVHRS